MTSEYPITLSRDLIKVMKLRSLAAKIPKGLLYHADISDVAMELIRLKGSTENDRKKMLVDIKKLLNFATTMLDKHGFVPTMSSAMSHTDYEYDWITYKLPQSLHGTPEAKTVVDEDQSENAIHYQTMFLASFELTALWYILNKRKESIPDPTLMAIASSNRWIHYSDNVKPSISFNSHIHSLLAFIDEKYWDGDVMRYNFGLALTHIDIEFTHTHTAIYDALLNNDSAALSKTLT